MSGPLISIVTACYNSQALIDRIHRSLAAQTYRRFEWICVDDRSTDGTVERLLALPDPGELPMQVYALPQNTFQMVAQAVGTHRSAGDIVIWLDHDDELFPDALSSIAAGWPLFQKDPRLAGLVYRAVDPVTGEPIGRPLPPGLRYSGSEAMNRFPDFSDGTIAYRGDLIRQIATVEELEPLVLNAPVVMRLTQHHLLQLADAAPIRYYHRDNPESQTIMERLSYKTVASYAAMINLADRHFLRQPGRWVRHIATMLRYGKAVHGRWPAALQYVDRPGMRVLCAALLPLAMLAARKPRGAPRIIEFKPLDRQLVLRLPDLRRDRGEGA